MRRDVVDGEGDLDAVAIRARGYGCAIYTGSAKPSDGWLAANADLVDWWIQETYSTRSAEVPSQGGADCRWAESVAKRYPATGQRISPAVSDGNGSDTWNAEQYGVDWSNAATLPFFPYGDTAICASFIRGALRGAGSHLVVVASFAVYGTWIPDSWGGGTLASQVANAPSPIPNTDLDHVFVDFSAPPAPTLEATVLFCYHHAPGAPVIDTYLSDGGVIIRQYVGLETVNRAPFGVYHKDGEDEIARMGATPITLTDAEFAEFQARTAAAKGQAPAALDITSVSNAELGAELERRLG